MAIKYTINDPNLTQGFSPDEYPNISVYSVWDEFFIQVDGFMLYGRRVLTEKYLITINDLLDKIEIIVEEV